VRKEFDRMFKAQEITSLILFSCTIPPINRMIYYRAWGDVCGRWNRKFSLAGYQTAQVHDIIGLEP
jgi:hypothetical protein